MFLLSGLHEDEGQTAAVDSSPTDMMGGVPEAWTLAASPEASMGVLFGQ